MQLKLSVTVLYFTRNQNGHLSFQLHGLGNAVERTGDVVTFFGAHQEKYFQSS